MSEVCDNSSERSICKHYCWNWREILAALGLPPKSDEDRRRVRTANIEFAGPIVLPTKGGQPRVCKEELLSWWDSLKDRFREQQQKRLDAQATVAASYQHGKGAVVLPDINGHVRKRRQR